jgi:hypothetical protein
MSSINLIQNLALDDAATNDDTSTVGEPSLGVAGQRIFVTGNWYCSRSTNSGGGWTHVDPFTTLPSAAGGFCCDQVTLHDAGRGVWIWILQYIEQNGANVFRIAATRDGNFPAGGWYWWDIAPTTLSGDFTNLWFDYPDAALTRSNLYVTFNVFNANDQWQRAVVMQFPLDTIANAGSLGFRWWSTTEFGSLRLTQGATSRMYWGSHASTTKLRLFRWVDGENSISWWDVNVRRWASAISSTAPNGVNWLGRTDPRITGGSVGDGVITFMWTAGSDSSRPRAYVRVVRIRESNKQVLDQPDIWSRLRAWAYPAACTNRNGTIGFTAFYGGEDRHPGLVVGARDDASSSWTTRYANLGSDSPAEPKWGDYLTCRRHQPNTDGWVASGYTLQGGDTRQDILPRVVQYTLVP